MLFEIDKIHCEEQVKELGNLKRSYEESDDEEQQSSKQLKLTEEYLVDDIPEIFSLPSLDDNENDE